MTTCTSRSAGALRSTSSRNLRKSLARWRAMHLPTIVPPFTSRAAKSEVVPCRSSSRVRSSACPGAHRQRRLGPVERLHLALLVDAQHDGTFGRQQVKPNYIRHLLDEQQMGRELERLATVRLQPEGPPDAMHRRWRMSDLVGHGSQGPWFPGAMVPRLQCVAPSGREGRTREGGTSRRQCDRGRGPFRDTARQERQ
jgi:hypothetical protein